MPRNLTVWLTWCVPEIFPPSDRIGILRWLSQFVRTPFLLWRWTMDASLNSCGTASSCQMTENRCSNLWTSGIRPHFNTWGGMQLAPGALPFVSDFIAQWTSCSDGRTARLASVGRCEISKRTDASNDDGWLRIVLKCSTQRFIMSDCLVSRVVPFLLKTGIVPASFGLPKTFLKLWQNELISCLSTAASSSEAMPAHHESFIRRSSRWTICRACSYDASLSTEFVSLIQARCLWWSSSKSWVAARLFSTNQSRWTWCLKPKVLAAARYVESLMNVHSSTLSATRWVNSTKCFTQCDLKHRLGISPTKSLGVQPFQRFTCVSMLHWYANRQLRTLAWFRCIWWMMSEWQSQLRLVTNHWKGDQWEGREGTYSQQRATSLNWLSPWMRVSDTAAMSTLYRWSLWAMIAERLSVSGLLLFVSSRVRTFHEATHKRFGFSFVFTIAVDRYIQPVAMDRQDRLEKAF